jgi:hypothetical protein
LERTTATSSRENRPGRDLCPEGLRRVLVDGAFHMAGDSMMCAENAPPWARFQHGPQLDQLHDLALGLADFVDRLPDSGAHLAREGGSRSALMAGLAGELLDRIGILLAECDRLYERLSAEPAMADRVRQIQRQCRALWERVRADCPLPDRYGGG